VLGGRSDRERLLAAAWLAGYRSPRTRRAYAGDLAGWLDWLAGLGVDVLDARRVHVDLLTRQLLDSGAAPSSTTRRLLAVTSFYHHLVEHDVLGANPAASVRRPKVDPDHTSTVGLDRDQARAFLAADVADLGHDRGHRVLAVVRKGGRRATAAIPPATGAALDAYLATRPLGPDGLPVGPLLATASGARLDQSALWKLVRRLARAAGIPQWRELSPHSMRHTAITLALDASVPLRDVQDYAGHRDPRTTRGYDRSRGSLDRNAAYTLTSYLA
jgi:integrase/recombinase XerD